MASNSLTLTDSRTGRTYEIPSPTAPSAPWICERANYMKGLSSYALRPRLG